MFPLQDRPKALPILSGLMRLVARIAFGRAKPDKPAWSFHPCANLQRFV